MTDTLLKRSAIDASSGTDKTHFLNSKARRNNRSLGDATGLTGIGVHLITVPPGHASTECHAHHHEDECAYVLTGTGTVTIGDADHDIGPGDFVAYPKGGEAHLMTNTGEVPLVCLVIGERLACDVVDYPGLGKRLFRASGLPWQLVDRQAIEEPNAGAK